MRRGNCIKLPYLLLLPGAALLADKSVSYNSSISPLPRPWFLLRKLPNLLFAKSGIFSPGFFKNLLFGHHTTGVRKCKGKNPGVSLSSWSVRHNQELQYKHVFEVFNSNNCVKSVTRLIFLLQKCKCDILNQDRPM